MKQRARTIGIIAVALAAILLALPFLFDANEFRPALESKLSDAAGRRVKLGSLHLSVFSGGITADDLFVADDPAFSPNPFLRAKSLKARVEMTPLIFSRKLNVTALTIDQPEITLVQNAAGRWNFSSLGSSRAKASHEASSSNSALDLSAKLVKISDGRVSLERSDRQAKPETLDHVNLELQDFAVNSAFPFDLSAKTNGGGDLRIHGKAGPIDAADASMTPLEATLAFKHVDPVASGFVSPAAGISGLFSMDGTATSNGRTVVIKSHVTGEKWVLAKGGSPATRTLELDSVIEHNLHERTGVLSRGDVHIGRVRATLGGTYSLRGGPAVVNVKLSGSGIPLAELAADLRALDIILPAGSSIQTGTFSSNLTMEGPVERLVTTGPIRIENLHLAGFNLGAKLAEVERLAGIQSGPNTDIQSASAELRAGPEGTTLSGIRIVSSSIGELTGAGTISANHALNFRMIAVLRGSGGVLAIVGRQSNARIPFTIQGTSSNPSFRPDVGAIASQQIQGAVGNAINRNVPGNAGGLATGILKGLLGGKK